MIVRSFFKLSITSLPSMDLVSETTRAAHWAALASSRYSASSLAIAPLGEGQTDDRPLPGKGDRAPARRHFAGHRIVASEWALWMVDRKLLGRTLPGHLRATIRAAQ